MFHGLIVLVILVVQMSDTLASIANGYVVMLKSSFVYIQSV